MLSPGVDRLATSRIGQARGAGKAIGR